MKKLLIALTLMLVLLAGVAAAENTGLEAGEYLSDKEAYQHIVPKQLGNYWYIILKDGTAEIVRYTGNDNELTIPAKLNGVAVSSIGCRAFDDSITLTNVVIPEGVTHIGIAAFKGCENIVTITIPDTVNFIEYAAFFQCSDLSSVIIPNGVTEIFNDTFSECHSLTTVTIPDSVTFIAGGAFWYCESLTSLTIPPAVTSIGEKAFYECPNLTLTVTPFSAAEENAKVNEIPYVYAVVNSWTCPECQNYNEADFCTECGTKQPEPTAEPTLAPVDDGSWDCTCGSHNFGKFCGNCGTKKPEPAACPNCGHVAEGAATNFCTECGAKFE